MANTEYKTFIILFANISVRHNFYMFIDFLTWIRGVQSFHGKLIQNEPKMKLLRDFDIFSLISVTYRYTKQKNGFLQNKLF